MISSLINRVVIAGSLLLAGNSVFAEEEALPRNLTESERSLIELEPIVAAVSRSGVPIGPIDTPAEYDPTEAIIVSWIGTSSWLAILSQMGAQITTTGNADLHVIHETTSARNSAISSLTSAGANMSRVKFFQINLDSIWVRDYGPRYIYEGGVRAIVDHTYNRPRFQDNAMPAGYAAQRSHLRYDMPLVHGGGNYHLINGPNEGYATELITDENPGLSQSEILAIWQQYKALATTLTSAFPTTVDATQHIDMWMIPVSENTVIVSEWPFQPSTIQASICNAFASTMQGLGYTVFRTPARTVSGTHYTYTNSVICNDLVLIPSYTNSGVSALNSTALSVWQAALPGKTIVQINCQAIVTAAGVMHCIVKHVPMNSGGTNPVVHLRTPNGGESFDPGESVIIEWISDDDVSVSSLDILLSTDAGATFPTSIATGLTSRNGTFNWTVPDVYSEEALVRIIVRDADANEGFDLSDGFFTINGVVPNPCQGDITGDSMTDLADFNVLAVNFGSVGVDRSSGDLNNDGNVDLADFNILAVDFGCGSN